MSEDLKISWKPVDNYPDYLKDYKFIHEDRLDQDLEIPDDEDFYSVGYDGPMWRKIFEYSSSREKQSLREFGDDDNDDDDDDEKSFQFSSGVEQYHAYPSIWWGIEASPNLDEGEGFFVNIIRSSEIPSEMQQPTWTFICLNGVGGGSSKSDIEEEHEFGIFFQQNSKPKIFNYGRQKTIEMHNISPPGNNILFSLVEIGRKLVFSVNGQDFVYNATEEEESFDYDSVDEHKNFDYYPMKFKLNDISVWGSNCTAVIKFSKMFFLRGSVDTEIIDPLSDEGRSEVYTDDGLGEMDYDDEDYFIKKVRNEESFYGARSDEHGDGDGHLSVRLEETNDGEYIAIDLTPSDDGYKTPCFNLLSRHEFENLTKAGGGVSRNLSRGGRTSSDYEIMSISLTSTAVDNWHSKQTAVVKLYTPGGFNEFETSKGIQINLGWGDDDLIFTGLTTDSYRSETPGLETTTIVCEDYMYILENVQMFGSPFYDGLYAFDAVYDIARRVGIVCHDDSSAETAYGIPVGYKMTKPIYRFENGRSLKDCILDCIKMSECYIYFDEEGELRYADIPGGLSASKDLASPVETFNVQADDGEKIIIDEYKVEKLTSQAVTYIAVETMDRTSGKMIFLTKWADENDRAFMFPKPAFMAQAAFGNKEAANEWINHYEKRVFFAPTRISFSTPAVVPGVMPTKVIEVDGQYYRVSDAHREFDAEANSLKTTISADWYGD